MRHYLVTGGSGYIGSLVIKELYKRAEMSSEKITVTAFVRSVEKARIILADLENKKENNTFCEISFIEADITDVQKMNEISDGILCGDVTDVAAIDYIIHCAAPTTSSYMISHPVETADSIVLGTRNMLELAKKQSVKSMVYLSSMEVYGQVEDIGRPRKEEELGNVALDTVRSCYPLGKRMAEHYCHIYAKEYGVPVKIARLAQTFGVGVREEDNRVYMQFARATIEGNDIILRTRGTSIGNYCAADDAVAAIMLVLEAGTNGEVYNVVNEAISMQIKDMAEFVASKIAGGRIAVRIELEESSKTGYAADTKLRISGEKLKKLGWMTTKDLEEMYRDVINCLS